MKVVQDDLLPEFLAESDEHLDAVEENLLVLESQADDMEALNAVFRSFHTIKGGAGILDMEELSAFAHRAESLLDLARDQKIVLQGQTMNLCYSALDVLKGIVTGMKSGEEEIDLPGEYQTVMQDLEVIMGGGVLAGDGGEALEAPPASPAPVLPPQGNSASVRGVDLATAATPVAESSKQEVESTPVQSKAKGASNSGKKADSADAKGARKAKQVGNVKVATDRLDAMINLVGELVITTAMVQQETGARAGTTQNLRSVGQLNKVTNELQQIAMSMRMVPLKATFQKAARMVRDVAAKCKKRVRFAQNGEDTELDRNVVERLADPLVHMLRNSVDHGVEAEELRVQAGKDPIGTVTLSAYHQGGNVVLELRDDGGGMNRGAILRKAVGKGLISQEQADAMPDQDVWPLIFHPGLSTSESLSEVSGRGVGMDVVKKNIEALRGSVEIDSNPGTGTCFTIRLPLTLAIIDAMVVKVSERTYILPTLSINRFLRPEDKSLFSIQGDGEAVRVRDEVLPLHRLDELLGIEREPRSASDGLLAITSSDGSPFALLVDDLEGQQQVVIKSLGTSLDSCPGVAGAAILGDGTVGLILDPDELGRLARGKSDPLLTA